MTMMPAQKLEILGCPCLAFREKEAVGLLLSIVDSAEPGYCVAINAGKIWAYSKNIDLKDIINQAKLPYPDGSGAVLGLKWLYGVDSEKINMPVKALEAANQRCLRTFIIGARESVHDLAIKEIKSRYQKINLVGHMHGYHPKKTIAEKVRSTRPNLILIAMGSPKQEIFAAELIAECQYGLAIGCGGALDIMAGKVKRAPKFLVDNNLEWLYRLFKQPWRLPRQFFLPLFFLKLLLAVFRKKVGK